MLTKEIIKSNKGLEGLTDEQLNILVTLSQNDENNVIGAKFSEVYQKLDATIAKETGISRNGDEKTYNYLERAARELKSQLKSVEPLNAKIAELTSEKQRLEEAIKSGQGNDELKKQLEQAKADFSAVTKQFNDLKKDFEKSNAQHAKELLDVNITNELSKASTGLQFKKDLPTGVTSMILEQTLAKVKGMNPEFIDNGQGGKILAFKDSTGAIIRNPENQLKPFMASELITKELKSMGVLDEGRKATGAGSQTPSAGGSGGGAFTIDISGARTRSEAQDIIATSLMQQGLTNGSDKFQEAMDKAWTDNNVSSLPIN